MIKQKILKTILVTGMGVIASTAVCFGMTACETKAPNHEHSYSQTWEKDDDNHWQTCTGENCTDEAGTKYNKAAHDTNGTDGACSVCGYKETTVTHEHSYSQTWEKDDTNHWQTCTGENCTDEAGTKYNKAAHDTKGTDGACSVCGYKETTVTHEHTYSETWEKDDDNHWQTCTGENCTDEAGTKYNKAAHDTKGTDGACSVCGYKAEEETPEHEHTYSTEWSKDDTNHWHAATCAHKDEKSDSAAHDKNGTDGACSVCGYHIYTALLEKTGKLIDEKFDTAQDKLPEFGGTYGTVGVYYTGATDGHYAKVEGGKAQMVKPANGESRILVDIGLTAGTVEGYLEATIGGSANNSWTFLRLLNASGSEIFGLRSKSGNISYRLDGGSEVSGLNTIAFSQTTYKVYFIFDGATKKLTMTINGTEFVKGVELSASELGGILLVSGNSHAGVVSLDNLVIVNDISFADLQTAVKARLQTVYSAYDLEVAYATNGTQITAAKDTGDTEITAAETKEQLLAAYNKAVAAMKAVKSELSIYKDGKIEELNAYADGKGESNYTAENWTALQGKVTAGIESINKAADTAAVDAALAEAKTAIDEILDNSAQAGLNDRDDCEIPIYIPDAESTKELDFTPTTLAKGDNLKNFDNYAEFKDSFLGIGEGTGRVQIKSGYLDLYSGASDGIVGGILTVTTATAGSVLAITFNGVNPNRYFIIYDAAGNVYGDGKAVTEGLPTGAYEQKAADSNKVLTITLGGTGVYTLKFAAAGNTKAVEHKIEKISLTATTEQTATAKVNKVEATVLKTPTAGVEVANLVSKISVQFDYNGEMITREITEKDKFTVIVKDSAGKAVSAETLEAGTYSVLVISGSGKEESSATRYNSHTCTVTVEAAPPEHEHTYSTVYSKDETQHWYAATCGHTELKQGVGNHDTKGTDGACSVCGYNPAVVPPTHEHTYSETWKKDDTSHWQTCTGENCTDKAGTKYNEADHDTKGTDGACSVCGYKAEEEPTEHEHTYSNVYSKDETQHWYEATCEHTDLKQSVGYHDTLGANGACSFCGYKAEEVTPPVIDAKILSYKGYNESLYISWTDSAPAQAKVYYKPIISGNWTEIDSPLIRATESGVARADAVGLAAGSYNVKIKPSSGDEIILQTPITVTAYDRSGYAHFNHTEGVGAYTDKGVLKSGTLVIYVTEENKNNVLDYAYLNGVKTDISQYMVGSDGTQYKGIGELLNNRRYSGNDRANVGISKLCDVYGSVAIRILGKVTADMNADGTSTIIGLTDYDSLGNGGSEGDNGRMARMCNAKNLTIEGIGEDASIFGWGVHFIASEINYKQGVGKNFEVRNIIFQNYAEDAIGMEGEQKSKKADSELTFPVERCWVHNNVFLPGYCAKPAESDKAEGDGSCDFKRGRYFTMSYNYFENCHKTNLIGSSSTSVQHCITMHHNWWNNCGSRIPLVRAANVHFYNNYVFGDMSATPKPDLSYVHSVRANSYIFSEANYYDGCKEIAGSSEGGGAVKAYNNAYHSCFKGDISTIVKSRTATVPNNCKYIFGNIDYSTFDTDSSKFYYNAEMQVSDCLLDDAVTARIKVMRFAGVNGFGTLKTDILNTVPNSAVQLNAEGETVITLTGGPSTVNGVVFASSGKLSSGVLKIKGQGIFFTLDKKVKITVTTTSTADNAPDLLRADGAVIAGKFEGTLTIELDAGTYCITSGQKEKESIITALSFTVLNGN